MEKIIYRRIKETENLSRRALVDHYNAFLSELNFKDNTLIYSWLYFNDFELVLESESDRKSMYVLSFCEKHGFSCHYKSGKCTKCISEKNGLGNPEIHKKTIDAQIKNGTFNMMNPEIQKKKVSNSNIKFKRINLYCEICQKITDHRIWNNGVTNCSICNSKNNGPRIKICPIHGETLHNGKYCIECHPESFSLPPKPEMKICPIHGETLHNGKYCLICHLKSVGGFIKNFTPEKLQPCGHTAQSVFNGENYVCWQCYKEDYIKKIQKDNLVSQFGGQIIPTFLDQNKTNSIPGNKFEKYLAEMDIGWFVYIKFHENGSPLVVGKSGSILVNSNGSDLSFDRNKNGGPARQLLIETNTNWKRTNIEIITANDEIDALNTELYLQNLYGIFGS